MGLQVRRRNTLLGPEGTGTFRSFGAFPLEPPSSFLLTAAAGEDQGRSPPEP